MKRIEKVLIYMITLVFFISVGSVAVFATSVPDAGSSSSSASASSKASDSSKETSTSAAPSKTETSAPPVSNTATSAAAQTTTSAAASSKTPSVASKAVPSNLGEDDSKGGGVASAYVKPMLPGSTKSAPDALTSQDWGELLTSDFESNYGGNAIGTTSQNSGHGNSGGSWMLIVGILLIVLSLGGIGYVIYINFLNKPKDKGTPGGAAADGDYEDIMSYTEGYDDGYDGEDSDQNMYGDENETDSGYDYGDGYDEPTPPAPRQASRSNAAGGRYSECNEAEISSYSAPATQRSAQRAPQQTAAPNRPAYNPPQYQDRTATQQGKPSVPQRSQNPVPASRPVQNNVNNNQNRPAQNRNQSASNGGRPAQNNTGNNQTSPAQNRSQPASNGSRPAQSNAGNNQNRPAQNRSQAASIGDRPTQNGANNNQSRPASNGSRPNNGQRPQPQHNQRTSANRPTPQNTANKPSNTRADADWDTFFNS